MYDGNSIRLHLIDSMVNSRFRTISALGRYFAYLWQYRSIYVLGINKELKVRFNNTVLGYFWHLINPLSQIVIYFVIFTVIFGREIPYYWVYLPSGLFAYTLFSQSLSGGGNSIVNNANMVTKMSLAREVIVFSKTTAIFITSTISYLLLLVVCFIGGFELSFISLLFIPFLFLMAVFSTGVALIVSALVVYLRDISNAIAVILGCLMFSFPVVYIASQRTSSFMNIYWSISPPFYYIESIHDVIYYGILPPINYIVLDVVMAVVTLIVGLLIFKRLETGFAERL